MNNVLSGYIDSLLEKEEFRSMIPMGHACGKRRDSFIKVATPKPEPQTVCSRLPQVGGIDCAGQEQVAAFLHERLEKCVDTIAKRSLGLEIQIDT